MAELISESKTNSYPYNGRTYQVQLRRKTDDYGTTVMGYHLTVGRDGTFLERNVSVDKWKHEADDVLARTIEDLEKEIARMKD